MHNDHDKYTTKEKIMDAIGLISLMVMFWGVWILVAVIEPH